MPGFSAVVLLVLALGIGANTAIFSVLDAVVLCPLPYRGADHWALVWETDLHISGFLEAILTALLLAEALF
jgi:hypothetical protein